MRVPMLTLLPEARGEVAEAAASPHSRMPASVALHRRANVALHRPNVLLSPFVHPRTFGGLNRFLASQDRLSGQSLPEAAVLVL